MSLPQRSHCQYVIDFAKSVPALPEKPTTLPVENVIGGVNIRAQLTPPERSLRIRHHARKSTCNNQIRFEEYPLSFFKHHTISERQL